MSFLIASLKKDLARWRQDKTALLIWLGIPFLIGGLIGALLVFFIFDWALIFISSLAGASMVIQALSINPGMEFGLYLALVIFGLLIQTVLFRKSTSPKEKN